MSHVPLIDPEHSTGRAKEIFAGPLKGQAFNLFKALANAPAALDGYLALTGALSKGVLSAKEREAVALAVAATNQCGYCAAAHTAIGRKAGLSEADTVAARQGTPTDARLAALVRFTRLVQQHRGELPSSEVAAFRLAGFDDAAIVEVFGHIGAHTLTNFFNNFNQTPLDFPPLPRA